MLSNEEKISLLKIEGKRLVKIYESEDIKENMFAHCPVCIEAGRLITRHGESACDICGQLGVKKRCKQYVWLSDGFLGIAHLLGSQRLGNEEIDSKKKIKELILEVKDEIDRISNE